MKLTPLDNETEEAFLARADQALRNELPEQAARDAVAFAQWKQRERMKNSGEEFPKKVSIRHLEPGLVFYEYVKNPKGGQGTMCLITRAYMDRIRQTIVGKPIINRTHRDLPDNPIDKGEGDGIIIRAYNDPNDGWDWVDALVWDEATVQNIRNGYEASCEHEMTEMGPAGVYHGGTTYDVEPLNGFYTHIAIVPKGRYEGVRITMMNSKPEGGKTMKISFWPFNKDTKVVASNAVEVETEKATVKREDGTDVPLSDAIAAYTEKEKADALRNAAPQALADTDLVQVGDKKVPVSELKAALAIKAKNEADDKMEKAHKDGDHKEKPAENCSMCNKAKNEADAEAAKKKEKDEEAEKEKAKNSAAELARAVAAGKPAEEFKAPTSLQDRAEKGRDMFGSKKLA